MQDMSSRFQGCRLNSLCFIAFPVRASDLQSKHCKVDDLLLLLSSLQWPSMARTWRFDRSVRPARATPWIAGAGVPFIYHSYRAVLRGGVRSAESTVRHQSCVPLAQEERSFFRACCRDFVRISGGGRWFLVFNYFFLAGGLQRLLPSY